MYRISLFLSLSLLFFCSRNDSGLTVCFTGDVLLDRGVRKKMRYVFRAEPEWLPALRKQGITHAAMANNHTMDQGREGITDTYNNLKASGITPIGYGINQQEACKPIVIEKNGVKVALFNSFLLSIEDWELREDEVGVCQASTLRRLKITTPTITP